jgi:beta-glucosidase
MGLFDHPNFNSRASNVTSIEHNDLARKLSAASTVLLKNHNPASKAPPLPLQKQAQNIAFIGRASDNCFTHSGGSGSVQPSRVVTPLQGAMSKISGSSLTYIDGKDIEAAVAVAKAADVAVVFAGTTSSEGYDRQNLNLDDNLDALIAAVAAAQPNTVVVLSVPGAIVMPWAQVQSQSLHPSLSLDLTLSGCCIHRHKLHAWTRGRSRGACVRCPPSLYHVVFRLAVQ